ncbi:MAG TPA: segregation/condensation protein A, partial [bacterium]|nr:segregation/condensation protein A [bacterium]
MAAAPAILAGPEAGISPESLFNEFTVKLPVFEGPLDLLLHLIKKHEIDIFDIPIAFITSEYLSHLRALEELDVTLSSEFLVMAATLVHIKSQMLLPSQYLRPELTDQEYRRSLSPEDPRFELVQALLSKQALTV